MSVDVWLSYKYDYMLKVPVNLPDKTNGIIMQHSWHQKPVFEVFCLKLYIGIVQISIIIVIEFISEGWEREVKGQKSILWCHLPRAKIHRSSISKQATHFRPSNHISSILVKYELF